MADDVGFGEDMSFPDAHHWQLPAATLLYLAGVSAG